MSVKADNKSVSAQVPTAASRNGLDQKDELLLKRAVTTWKNAVSSKWPSKQPLRPEEQDPFGCTCGPCKRFWKENFQNVSILEQPVIKRAQETSSMFRPEQAEWRIKVGDRVIVNGKQKGVVKFVGLLDENIIAPSVYVGIRCDDQIGSTHNGVLNGKRYFHCARGHAALVPYPDVRPINPPEARPPLKGNFMFPSYQEVIKTRALRAHKMEVEDELITHPKETRISKKPMVYDENDVAYKDSQREGGHQVYRYANTIVKVRTGAAPKVKVDVQARRFAKWKEEFGGGDRGERLVRTLKKLHEGLNRGKEAKEEDLEEIIVQEPALPPISSKPPTRTGEYPPTRVSSGLGKNRSTVMAKAV